MIEVSEAIARVLSTVGTQQEELIPLHEAVGRTLAADVVADRDLPPFDRVTMDGIAIMAAHYRGSGQQYKVTGIAPAGEPQKVLTDEQQCLEVMTGAPLPVGCDTVVRYEDLTSTDIGYTINIQLQAGKNVHRQGSDHKQGDVLLPKGQELKAADINVLATVGQVDVPVLQRPTVAVISSGDELVPIQDIPKPHQIRASNSHMLAARLRQLGIEGHSYHLPDVKDSMTTLLADISDRYQVLLISGGVSKGKFDFMPEVLSQLGYETLFHRVAQRPGKPFWFGRKGSSVVFAFPGNPVSTLACFHRYFMPWYQRTMGQPSTTLRAVLAEDVSFKPPLTYFAQAKLAQQTDGTMMATVSHGKGSGDMVSPTTQDGFLELPADREQFRKGEVFNFIPFHPLY